MRHLLFFCVAVCLYGQTRAEDIWIARGLKAKFLVEPVVRPLTEGPSFRLLLELRNVGVEGSAGLISQEIQIGYNPSRLNLHITDETGRELALAPEKIADFMEAGSSLSLPPEAVLTFPVAKGGETPGHFDEGTGKLLEFNPLKKWIIPQHDGHTYSIAGTLTAKGEQISIAKVSIPNE